MTKTVKKSLALILSILMLMSVMPIGMASAVEVDGFTCESDGNNVYAVKGYRGSATIVTLPTQARINNRTRTLTKISNGALSDKNFEEVTIPNTFTTIGNQAFENCTQLTTITFGASISTVGANAFAGCSKLTTVNYTGTGAQWATLVAKLGSGNDQLKNATVNLNYGHNCSRNGHVLNAVSKIDATCSTDGNEAYWTCEVYNCKKNFADSYGRNEITDISTTVIPAGHLFTTYVSNNDAMCTEDGTETATCARNGCDETHTRTAVDSVLGHSMAPATCTEPSKCQREGCGYTVGEPNGHNKGEAGVDYIYFAPTCNDDGFHVAINCTACGILLEYGAGIPALGHEFEIVAEKSIYPTCVDAGYYYKECTREGCNETEEEWPAALDHQFPEEWTVSTAATCTTPGSEHRTCVRDNCKETQSRTINAFNHIGTTTTTVTENEQVGTCVDFTTYETVVYCSCDYEISRTPVTDAKNPNNHTNLVPTAATVNTCETDGNIAYWACAGCLKIYSDAAATTEITAAQTVIEKKGHAYGDEWTFDADGEHKKVCANDANHIDREDCVDVTTDTDCLCDKCGHLVSHSFGNPTCTDPAKCSVCDETTGSATGHDYGDWEYDEELDKHFAVCANDEDHIIYGDCENANADEDCECDYCDRVIEHDFADATCCAPKTCTVCEATEGEINAENHSGEEVVEIEDYIAGTCTSIESYNIVTYCLDCDEPIKSEEFEGEKDPDNHQLKEVIPNGGKDKEHYYVCEREGCEYKEDIPHNLGDYSIYEPATCTKTGRERAHCSICKSFIFRDIPVIPHVDANKNAKCDVCDTAMELPVEPEPEEPDAEEPPVVEDPSANCSCNCHARGLKGLFFSIVLFFQRLLGLNRTCDCGNAHY